MPWQILASHHKWATKAHNLVGLCHEAWAQNLNLYPHRKSTATSTKWELVGPQSQSAGRDTVKSELEGDQEGQWGPRQRRKGQLQQRLRCAARGDGSKPLAWHDVYGPDWSYGGGKQRRSSRGLWLPSVNLQKFGALCLKKKIYLRPSVSLSLSLTHERKINFVWGWVLACVLCLVTSPYIFECSDRGGRGGLAQSQTKLEVRGS